MTKPVTATIVTRAALLAGALGLGLLAGCAATGDEQTANPPTLLETLASTETSEYTNTRKCLSRFDYDHVEVLGSRHVAFKGPGKRLWVNELRQACVGLRRNDAIRIDRTTSQLCSLDTIEGIDRGFGIFDRNGPHCTLGDFHPVTEEQLALMRDTLR